MISLKFSKSNYPLHIFILGIVIGFVASCVLLKEEQLMNYYFFGHRKSQVSHEIKEAKSCYPFEQAVCSQVIDRAGYTLSYDGKNRIPSWVFEELTPESIKGNAFSHRFKFMEDDAIPKHLRSTLDDYFGTEYECMHLCPPDDQGNTHLKMYETFYLSNASPVQKGSKASLKELEQRIRKWTEKFDHLYVITGSLFLPSVNEDGHRYVKYRVIGPHNVGVPTHFYKVILGQKNSGEMHMCAFLIPNEVTISNKQLEHFLVSTKEIESLSGLEFFKGLRSPNLELLKNNKKLF
jgi:endonuclease G